MNEKLYCLALAMLISSSAFADYYLVDPSGEVYPARRTQKGYEATRTSQTFAFTSSPGFIDTVWYYDPDLGLWYYPDRDSNTIVMQLFSSPYLCSLVAVGIRYGTPGWAEFYAWEGPDTIPSSTEELQAHIDANWHYDTLAHSWVSWPTILYGPDSIGSDEPRHAICRWCWVDLQPRLDVATDAVWVGYRIIDRSSSPCGGGKPWPLSDSWVDPDTGFPHYSPCRSWMYVEMTGRPRDDQWLSYGDETGDWLIMYVIDMYGTGTDDEEQPNGRPLILQGAPNPFTDRTLIKYECRRSGMVHVAIYDLLGQEIRTLVDAEQNAGLHTTMWDSRNDTGKKVPSGTYFLRLEAGQHIATRKVCVVR